MNPEPFECYLQNGIHFLLPMLSYRITGLWAEILSNVSLPVRNPSAACGSHVGRKGVSEKKALTVPAFWQVFELVSNPAHRPACVCVEIGVNGEGLLTSCHCCCSWRFSRTLLNMLSSHRSECNEMHLM